MADLSLEVLKAFASGLGERLLLTRHTGARFSLRVTEKGFEYTPDSTGESRLNDWRTIERVLRHYNETRSLSPVDYRDDTFHASYVVALIAAYLSETTDCPLPEEILDVPMTEGGVRTITVNAYERDRKARERCIAAHQPICCVCGFDFGAVYGPDFVGLIHVHHLRPLSKIGHEYAVDPVNDLRPVCPNCHAAIHHGCHLRSIEQVKKLLAARHR